MRHGLRTLPSTCNRLLALLLTLMPRSSYAQNIADSSLAVSGSTSAIGMTTTNTQTASTAVSSWPSTMTSFMTPHASNTTTSYSSTLTREPNGIPPQLFGDSNPAHVRNEGVFNYYFLFLALFGLLIAAGLWYLHRQRKRRKEQMRLGGQNALERDLDGWINTRRWFHGAWRHNQTTNFVRREEGLDENGEAPPPYQPKSNITVPLGGSAPAQDPASGLAVPLRTLSRDGIEHLRPPEYRETANNTRSPDARPGIGNNYIDPNSSTQALVGQRQTPAS